MKKMFFGSLFLIGISFSQCLAWRIVGIRNELDAPVTVQVVKNNTYLPGCTVPAGVLCMVEPIECPICGWFVNLVKNGSPAIEEYLLVTVGQKRFIICEGGHTESSYNTTEMCKDEYGLSYSRHLIHHRGPYATWVSEVRSDPNIKVLDWTSGLLHPRDSVGSRYILKIGLLRSSRPTKRDPARFREDIVFGLIQ